MQRSVASKKKLNYEGNKNTFLPFYPSLLRSRFFGGGALRDIPKNGCEGDYFYPPAPPLPKGISFTEHQNPYTDTFSIKIKIVILKCKHVSHLPSSTRIQGTAAILTGIERQIKYIRKF